MAVMGYVGSRHEEIVMVQGGQSATALGAPVEGAALADHIAVAHLQARGSTLELQILGSHAQGGVGIDVIVLTEFGVGADHHVATQLGAGSDHGVALNEAEGAHDDAVIQPGLRTHDAARMDLNTHFPSPSARSISMDMNSASPRILQMRPLNWITFTSMTNWSPGSTGFRNFTASMPMK